MYCECHAGCRIGNVFIYGGTPLPARRKGRRDGWTDVALYQTVCGGGFGTGLACDSTDRRQSRRCPTITYTCMSPPGPKRYSGPINTPCNYQDKSIKRARAKARARASGRVTVSFNMIILTSSEGSTQSSPSAVQCQYMYCQCPFLSPSPIRFRAREVKPRRTNAASCAHAFGSSAPITFFGHKPSPGPRNLAFDSPLQSFLFLFSLIYFCFAFLVYWFTKSKGQR